MDEKSELAKQHGNNNAEKITADYTASSIWNAVGISLSCNGKLFVLLYVWRWKNELIPKKEKVE